MSTIVTQPSSPHPSTRASAHPTDYRTSPSDRPPISTTPTTVRTPPTTTRTPPTNTTNKSSDFSISNLLARDSRSSSSLKPGSQPTQVLTPVLNPTAMLLYHQWLATLARATITPQASLFHGTAVSVNSSTPNESGNDAAASRREHSSIVPGRLPNVSQLTTAAPKLPPSQSSVPARYSPSTSPSVSPVQSNGVEDRETITTPSSVTPSNQSSNSGGSGPAEDGRQNALLRVSEAHLAILPDEDGDT